MKIAQCSRSCRTLLGLFFGFLLTLPLSAQSAGSADPISLWDHFDNPAANIFFPDAVGMGVRLNFDGVDFSPAAFNSMETEIAYLNPGLAYRYHHSPLGREHLLGSGFHYQHIAGFGVRMRWNGNSLIKPKWDLGLMIRPSRFLSMAFSLEDKSPYGEDYEYDKLMGLSLRPFAFDRDLERLLSLSIDARWRDSYYPSITAGARVLLKDWISIQGNYDISNRDISAGLWLSLSGLETTLDVAPMDIFSQTARVSQAYRLGRRTKTPARAFGKSLLVIDGLDSWLNVPPKTDNDPGMGNTAPLWFDLALMSIEKAAIDPGISGLVIYQIPGFDSDARALEFSRALVRFKESGKPIYLHATYLDRRSYAYTAALADLVTLDPNGTLPIADVGFISIYFKNLFKKYGIDSYSLQSHDTKTANNRFTESSMTEAEREMMERFILGLSNSTARWMDSQRRERLKMSSAELIAKGPWLDPRKAVEAGLVDELMYRDEFDARLKELSRASPHIDLRSYARERSLSWAREPGKRVAIVHLKGSIISDEGEAGNSIGTLAIKALEDLSKDSSIAGVILRVDSGGGSAITSDRIARAVLKLKENGKKVVVSMAGYAASGGYYISAHADRIIAEENTVTGSIGVTGLTINVSRMLEKLELGTGVVSAGDSAVFSNPLLPYRVADDQRWYEHIMYIYERFIDTVAAGRGMEKERVDELGKGHVWLGSEALENGLIDEIGGLAEAKAAMEALIGSQARYEDHVPGKISFFSFLPAPLRGALALPSSLERVLSIAARLEDLGTEPLYLEPLALGWN